MRNHQPLLAALVLLGAMGCSSDSDGGTSPTPPAATPPSTPPPASPNPPPAATNSASVDATNDNRFAPADVNVKVGGTVTWTFGSVPHNVVFNRIAGAPANVPVTSSGTAERTFNTAGSFPYDCSLHAGMVGTVRVQS